METAHKTSDRRRTEMKYYVDANAAEEGNGSLLKPFRRINDAADIAVPGDEIIVRDGIYREYVAPRNAGTEEQRIVYRAEHSRGATITGAEPVENWEKMDDQVWFARIDNAIFGEYNPYTTYVCGDWYFAPKVRHTGSVYINGHMMLEAGSLDECRAGEKDIFSWSDEDSHDKWFTIQDAESTIIYGNFSGKDPNRELVEINVRRNCFLPEKTGVDYITVSGFVICKAATTWAPPAAYQDGMIGPRWSKGWVIEDCEICYSKCCGISLGKYGDPDNEMFFYHHRVKSPTQMERDAVCRGQYHGWTKEKIGHHVVKRCEIHHCEQTGIVGRMGCAFSTIEQCHIHHICTTQQLGGAETAGIKLHAAIDVTIRRNHIHHCVMGIWCDWEAQGTRISSNLMHDNQRPDGVKRAKGYTMSTDLFLEVSHGPTLVDNNLLMSKVSVTMPTQGLAFVHNLILGSFSFVNAGVDSIVNGQREPRYTPYHIQHRTEVAGFMTILHGDDRIYNNVFVQAYIPDDAGRKPFERDHMIVGTAPFQIFPTYEEWIAHFTRGSEPDMYGLEPYHFKPLPVWIDGNAYFNGATVYEGETNCLNELQGKAFVRLIEEDSKYKLETNLYEMMKQFQVSMITTDTLGKAFEPDQRFENPDGSDIVFDQDYLGEQRTSDILPGPFSEGRSTVVVWED